MYDQDLVEYSFNFLISSPGKHLSNLSSPVCTTSNSLSEYRGETVTYGAIIILACMCSSNVTGT